MPAITANGTIIDGSSQSTYATAQGYTQNSAGQYDYSDGASVGHSLATNTWLSLGYNLVGFRDEDFSRSRHTSQGPYLKFRIKFDQQSVKEALKWLGQ